MNSAWGKAATAFSLSLHFIVCSCVWYKLIAESVYENERDIRFNDWAASDDDSFPLLGMQLLMLANYSVLIHCTVHTYTNASTLIDHHTKYYHVIHSWATVFLWIWNDTCALYAQWCQWSSRNFEFLACWGCSILVQSVNLEYWHPEDGNIKAQAMAS